MIVRARTEINENIILGLLSGQYVRSFPKSSFYFLNSGSASLRLFLRAIGKGKRVGIQVFTCPSVLDSILSENCLPVFLDINPHYYTTTLDIIKNSVCELDVLILSHLFGIPNPDYIEIKELCKMNDVILLDDLCQTYHAKIGERYLEDLSDNYIYSFFYDKPISMLSGGMLKVCDTLKDDVEELYKELPQADVKKGKQNLRALFLLHQLLAPSRYTREFRNGMLWRKILEHWPIRKGLFILNLLLNSKMLVLLNKLCKPNVATVARMSEIESLYVQSVMNDYHDNNNNLIAFYKHNRFDLPAYLKNQNICCSVAKRAIVNYNVVSNEVQVGLYNWPDLICEKDDCSSYPMALSVIKTHTNIPCWTNCYKKLNIV